MFITATLIKDILKLAIGVFHCSFWIYFLFIWWRWRCDLYRMVETLWWACRSLPKGHLTLNVFSAAFTLGIIRRVITLVMWLVWKVIYFYENGILGCFQFFLRINLNSQYNVIYGLTLWLIVLLCAGLEAFFGDHQNFFIMIIMSADASLPCIKWLNCTADA